MARVWIAAALLGLAFVGPPGVRAQPADQTELATGPAKWRAQAEQGDAEAQFRLGYAYLHGEGVERDVSIAVPWLRKAAEQGHPHAQSTLGSPTIMGSA